ncbi:MAG: hypothetical protein F9K23_13845 [Bacteroidetes bacterium]|nr:MAG: hypothetical protein F9K23_13845 [Bacteroidota bacterium]
MKLLLKTYCLFILFCTVLQVSGQDAEWSNPEKFRNRTAFTKVVGQNATGIYVLRSKTRYFDRKVYVQLYKDNLGLVYSKQLAGLKKASLVNAIINTDGLRVFKSRFNRKINGVELIGQKHGLDAEPVGEEVVITNTPQRDYSDEGDFVVTPSADQTKVLCFHTEIDPEKKTVIEIVVLDANSFQELHRKKIVLPFRYGNFNPLESQVANNGNAYFIFRVENEDKRKKDFERFGYYLFAYDAAKNELTDFYLNNSDTYLSRPHLTLDYLSNKAIASGFYSLEDVGYSKGLLDFGLDMGTHLPLYHSFIPYPQDFVSSFIGNYAAQQGEELRDLYIRNIIPHSDSGYILMAEEYFTTTQTYTFTVNGMMQVGSRDVYNFGKVAVLSITKKGEVEWGKVINKSQTSSLDLGYYSSFYTLPLRDRVLIFYNDENRGNSEITQYTLTNKGVSDSKLLFKNSNSSIAVVPREGQQLDAATVLFPAAKDRKFAFLKLLVN